MFSNWFKQQIEKVIPHQHDFKLSYLVGEFHKYYCKKKNCNGIKYTLETRPSLEIVDGEYVWTEATTTVLTRDEAEPYRLEAEISLSATMWLLDNVEPTASAGRDDGIDYKYKIKDRNIVKNDTLD